jgi:hypothetical protein
VNGSRGGCLQRTCGVTLSRPPQVCLYTGVVTIIAGPRPATEAPESAGSPRDVAWESRGRLLLKRPCLGYPVSAQKEDSGQLWAGIALRHNKFPARVPISQDVEHAYLPEQYTTDRAAIQQASLEAPQTRRAARMF